MVYDWNTCPKDVKDYITDLKEGIKKVVGRDFVGFYIHGSLAMGGFNPRSSDIDVLVVVNNSMEVEKKKILAQLFLQYSNSPYPLEISFLNRVDLLEWRHPCPFELHYSEAWRKRFEHDLSNGSNLCINENKNTDIDLAAHITITHHRGLCIEGEPIDKVFPPIPKAHYISSIVADYRDCLKNITEDPIYCSLNIIRVYWYLSEGVISSKLEAGNWGKGKLQGRLRSTVSKAVDNYTGQENHDFNEEELVSLRNYLLERVEEILN